MIKNFSKCDLYSQLNTDINQATELLTISASASPDLRAAISNLSRSSCWVRWSISWFFSSNRFWLSTDIGVPSRCFSRLRNRRCTYKGVISKASEQIHTYHINIGKLCIPFNKLHRTNSCASFYTKYFLSLQFTACSYTRIKILGYYCSFLILYWIPGFNCSASNYENIKSQMPNFYNNYI